MTTMRQHRRVSLCDLSPAAQDLLERRYDGRIPQQEIEHVYQQEQQRKEGCDLPINGHSC